MNKSLANILRPKSLQQIIGQTHLLGQDAIIAKIVKTSFCPNLIFYGPPGVGKTTLAHVLSKELKANTFFFNASNDKKEKLVKFSENIIDSAKNIIIIDEIHRMNTNIQDYLLEIMEERKIVIFALTTENPFFVINPAIRSRSTILSLKEVTSEEMYSGLKENLKQEKIFLDIDDEAFRYICESANGDVRYAINCFEILINLYSDKKVDFELTQKIFQHPNIKGYKDGDEFHDLKSALQKSVRGSDVNASLHYWARLMEIGDYETLMRRMTIMAYEDIGLANPMIPMRVSIACDQFRKIGMPEGRIILGLAIIEMALSEKSNSSLSAIDSAISDVKNGLTPTIPIHIRDNHYKNAHKLNLGIGYKYPHDFPNDYVDQNYMPKDLKNVEYFKPKTHSVYESKIINLYNKFTNKKK